MKKYYNFYLNNIFNFYQEQVSISISSIELLYHTWVFDLGHKLNLILLLLLYNIVMNVDYVPI